MFTDKEKGSAVLYEKVSNQTSGNKAAEGESSSAQNQQQQHRVSYRISAMKHQVVRQLSLDNPIIK